MVQELELGSFELLAGAGTKELPSACTEHVERREEARSKVAEQRVMKSSPVTWLRRG